MRLTFLTEIWAILLVCALGLTAVYALLPRPRRLPLLLGVGATGFAFVLAGWLVVRVGKLSFETFLFYLFAATAIVAGGLLVTQQNPARAALSFAIVVLATCGLFLLQAAPFLMAATIIVYAGAIIVTFL
ncbi:MAG: NADH-quinone oxidoreductase subunit J, partial [Planctomycetes bacterium]|nr:NADH-quinone oxidoreductase subunit J [Planctomycetota bacterium]